MFQTKFIIFLHCGFRILNNPFIFFAFLLFIGSSLFCVYLEHNNINDIQAITTNIVQGWIREVNQILAKLVMGIN